MSSQSPDSLASLDLSSEAAAPSLPEIQSKLVPARVPATESGTQDAGSGSLVNTPIISRKERRATRSSSLTTKKEQQIDSDGEPDAPALPSSDAVSPRFNVARRAKWLPEDDAKLRNAHAQIMKEKVGSWRQVAQLAFPKGEFSMQSCIARWRTLSLPDHFTGPWTPEEDAKLKHAVEKHGTADWMLIESKMWRRTSKQCRER